MPDNYVIESDTRRQKADGTWEQTIKICVKDGGTATEDTTLWVTTWPYDTKFNKIGKDRRFDKLEFKKGDKCKTLVFEFPTEPKQQYTDLYRNRTADGKFENRIDYNVDIFAVMTVPPDQNGRGVLVAVMAVPYPFSLEQENLGPLQFHVSSISNVAPWQVDFCVPAEGELFTLDPVEKTIPLAVGLSTVGTLPEGYSHEITIEVVPVLDDLPDVDLEVNTAVYTLRIVKDTLAPTLVEHAPEIDVAADTAKFSWTLTDTVSGLRTPRLRYSLDAGATWNSRYLDVTREVYEDGRLTSGLFSTTISTCSARRIQYELVAADESFNTVNTGVVDLIF